MVQKQLVKCLILVAPLVYAIYIVMRCPCANIASCKLGTYYSLLLLAAVLATVENLTSLAPKA